MPEISVIHLGLFGLLLVVGLAIGWFIRGDRCAREKIAVNASWQEQLESQQSEHNRLAEQNKSLMEQISQYQASHRDYSNRAKELSGSLKEAFARRDEMQRQLKDARAKLEVAIAQRNRARQELESRPKDQSAALREKDDKIFQLSRELTSWQSRVPPLVEKFQEKSREFEALKVELDEARDRLSALDEAARSSDTRIEPVDANSLPDGGDASNEPIAMTSSHDTEALRDQLGELADDEPAGGRDTVTPVSDFGRPGGYDPGELVNDFTDVFSAVADEAASTAAAGNGEDVANGASPALPWANGEDTTPATYGMASTPEDRDDLQQIKGIGPSIERTLNGLGVYRFHQIAEMSEYDIDRVAQQIRGFRSRIYREDWIGQARDLQYQKNNARS